MLAAEIKSAMMNNHHHRHPPATPAETGHPHAQNPASTPPPPPPTGTARIGDLTLGKELGRGSFAKVYRAVRDGTGEVRACKRIDSSKLSAKLLQNLEAEIAILREYRHQNIVGLDGIHKTRSHIYLVLEFCAGGDLHRYIKRRGGRLPEAVAQHFMFDLTDGLAFLHSKELIHRDIKPQNLLLTAERDDARLKIADFGFARHLSAQSMADTLCGSPLYMAPEILMCQKYDSKVSFPAAALFGLMMRGRDATPRASLALLIPNPPLSGAEVGS